MTIWQVLMRMVFLVPLKLRVSEHKLNFLASLKLQIFTSISKLISRIFDVKLSDINASLWLLSEVVADCRTPLIS